MKRSTKLIIGALLIVAVAVGGFVFWVKVIKDSPDSFDAGSLDVALDATSTTAAGATTTVGDATASTATTVALTSDDATGTWTVGAGSEVGYRVKEVLSGLDTEGVGRTEAVTGTLTIDGTTVTAVELTVDMATFVSDSDRRDSQFEGRIMEVSQFPTATFVLTSPIELGAIPTEDEEIVVQATGDLTMHGVTNSVTFELTAKSSGGRIGVVGSTTIVFADYDIDNPSNGFAETGDDGTLELQLVFDRAG